MTSSEMLPRKPWIDVTIRAALIGAAVLVYLDLKAEIRAVRVDLGNSIERVETRLVARMNRLETRMDRLETRMDRLVIRINKLETRIDRVEAKVDRLETKIDEVRGYLKFDMIAPTEDPPPTDMKQ